MQKPQQGTLQRGVRLELPRNVVTLVTVVAAGAFRAQTSNGKYIRSRLDEESGFHVWRGFLAADWIENTSWFPLTYRVDSEFQIQRGASFSQPVYLQRDDWTDEELLALVAAGLIIAYIVL